MNAKDEDENTPLHRAAYYGHKEIVVLLIAKGAEADAKDEYDLTPLYFAARGGYKEVAEILIAKGANVNGGPLHNAVFGMGKNGCG